jgi:hypothetical protein
VDQGYAWAVSHCVLFGWNIVANDGTTEDFGLMLASCAIVRVIQEFPGIKLAPGESLEEPGTERQHLTLTLSNAEGCKVLLK